MGVDADFSGVVLVIGLDWLVAVAGAGLGINMDSNDMSLSSLGRFGRRPSRDASRDIPTAKHFFKRQNWQLLRENGVISHCCWFVH